MTATGHSQILISTYNRTNRNTLSKDDQRANFFEMNERTELQHINCIRCGDVNVNSV